jgi:hypothetical protein
MQTTLEYLPLLDGGEGLMDMLGLGEVLASDRIGYTLEVSRVTV